MSSERCYYEATCKKCGRKGFRIDSSDDWGRSEVSWEGFRPFTDFPRHDYLVGRKKIDPNEFAACECGSTDIEVGRDVVKTL
ncbi:MAG: hypothetical protein ACYDHM_02225 [Acidiferrobacterales bacterium]